MFFNKQLTIVDHLGKKKGYIYLLQEYLQSQENTRNVFMKQLEEFDMSNLYLSYIRRRHIRKLYIWHINCNFSLSWPALIREAFKVLMSKSRIIKLRWLKCCLTGDNSRYKLPILFIRKWYTCTVLFCSNWNLRNCPFYCFKFNRVTKNTFRVLSYSLRLLYQIII